MWLLIFLPVFILNPKGFLLTRPVNYFEVVYQIPKEKTAIFVAVLLTSYNLLKKISVKKVKSFL